MATGTKRVSVGGAAAIALIFWIGGRVEQRAPGTISAEVGNAATVAGSTGAGVINAGKATAQATGLGNVFTVPTVPTTAPTEQLGGVAGEGEIGR